MSIITPAGFAEKIGKKNPPSTVDNASVVAVTVPDTNEFTTVGIYNLVEKTVISKDGANYDRSFEPVTSIVLTPGIHFIRKYPHQFIHAPGADKVFAAAVREPK
jgi:hypothetical protein